MTLGSANRPSRGSSAEATDQGLAFYFNGEIDSGSQMTTESFGLSRIQYLEGMIVIDTNHRTARNLSTKAVSGDIPRSRGQLQYIPGIGTRGILIALGGNQQSVLNQTDSFTSNLVGPAGFLRYEWLTKLLLQVPMNAIDVFDVSSYYNTSTPDGVWYKQTTSGETPQGRIDFCTILASASDGSSHNM